MAMDLTPRQIVAELDKYIVGQGEAKKLVAVALRNRWRCRRLDPKLREEVIPKNILMIGPTGVGKTEIARRLARLVDAPFVKVEATKFTEVGYVGRDVESMVRELVETSVRIVKQRKMAEVEEKARELAEERIIDCYCKPRSRRSAVKNPLDMLFGGNREEAGGGSENNQPAAADEDYQALRQRWRQRLRDGKLEDDQIEITVEESALPVAGIITGGNMEEMGINLQEMLGGLMPKKPKNRLVTVRNARKIFTQEESQKLIDMEEIVSTAVRMAETDGIIFLDEIDKIAGRGRSHGPDVSREGVQRDILPIVEGSTVVTKYGPVKTDQMLFIAAGAFHMSKPSDLIPELQGRFPIRVELNSLTEEDFRHILTDPANALIKQYQAMLATEQVELTFDVSAIGEIAAIACRVNAETENIGARRLHTILEKLVEDIAFAAPDIEDRNIVIDAQFVRDKLGAVVKDQDLSRFIL
ncbi:MAG: ATP-dependent protease ATPase subunit HslU [Negativicutes bacterium]|nr:ATP-dependent protease ATPase subunit HslU [Negativicutes bacterium]